MPDLWPHVAVGCRGLRAVAAPTWQANLQNGSDYDTILCDVLFGLQLQSYI